MDSDVDSDVDTTASAHSNGHEETAISNEASSSIQSNEDIDYNSVAGLMQALDTHGPNVVEGNCGLDNAFSDAGTTQSPPAASSTNSQRNSEPSTASRIVRYLRDEILTISYLVVIT